MSLRTTYQFDAGYFCAGIEVDMNRVVKAAPILKWSINKSVDDVLRFAQAKGWKVTEVKYE